jgi:BirA family biotin operon repressor/biotin-[acetyl-CoA-carboxylase] ligase
MDIIYFEKLESTNLYCKKNIKSLQDKTVVSADIQTHGYGRFNRSWVDLGSENIYMSFVLKPFDKLTDTHANLTQYLSVILCKQLEDMGLFPQIKWPNDVLLNNKKMCGILAESIIKNGILKGIILGIGINLNASADDLRLIDRPATALNIELEKIVNKREFMQKLVENFFYSYDDFLEHGFVSIKKDYEKRACFLNQNLKIAVFKLVKVGFCSGIDEGGNLILDMPDGKTEKINMGEII